MLWTLSLALRLAYLVLPVAAIVGFSFDRRARYRRVVGGGMISGTLLGAGLLSIYTLSIGGKIGLGDVFLTIYLGMSLMLLLRLIDAGLQRAVCAMFGLANNSEPAAWRRSAALLVRLGLFAMIGLPWVMAAIMTYRPHTQPVESPASMFAAPFEPVEFRAADGTRLAAWYIPAANESDTVALVCHGLGATKDGMWPLMKKLHDSNVNILTLDLRAHGMSGSHLCTFGAKESLDVQAAAAWLKQQRPHAARRVVGVGASMGGAALVMAAARSNDINAIALLGSYDDLGLLTDDLSRNQFSAPLGWLIRNIAFPLASLHAGVDLNAVRPVADIVQLWPRPVLVIHGLADEIIPFNRGRALYNAAAPPRESLWLPTTHNGVLDDNQAIDTVVDFVLTAEESPLI